MKWRHVRQRKSSTYLPSPRPIYAGFWTRTLGFVTDLFMIGLPISLLFMLFFGRDQMHSAGAIDLVVAQGQPLTNAPDPLISILQMLLSMLVYVSFWRVFEQTPGKKMARIRVVDAVSFERASWWQLSFRFLGYFLSALPLFMGFFVALFRKDRRALHDLISSTAVIYEPQQ